MEIEAAVGYESESRYPNLRRLVLRSRFSAAVGLAVGQL
jgi:hypothetical protein